MSGQPNDIISAEPPIQPQPMEALPPGATRQKTFAMESPAGYAATNDACYEGMMTCLGFTFGTLGSLPFCCCFPNPFQEVFQGTVGLVSKFGRFVRAVDPGLYKINPFCEQLRVVDVRV